MARIAWFFPTRDEQDLPERIQNLFAKARATLGFVPNVFRGYAYKPDRFSAWFSHFRLLHVPTPGLDAADREMIGVVVSAYNRCTYCIVAHGQTLRAALGGRPEDAVLADYIAANWRTADLDPRRAAICAFAEKVTATPGRCEEADLQALEAVGLAKEDIWDVIEIAAMYNFTNRMALATGQMPNEEYHTLDRPKP